jgi:transcription initiation factor TFIIE subunit alpha
MLILLIWAHSLKDDDLAGRMGLQPKELNKVIAVLSNDCLVKM